MEGTNRKYGRASWVLLNTIGLIIVGVVTVVNTQAVGEMRQTAAERSEGEEAETTAAPLLSSFHQLPSRCERRIYSMLWGGVRERDMVSQEYSPGDVMLISVIEIKDVKYEVTATDISGADQLLIWRSADLGTDPLEGNEYMTAILDLNVFFGFMDDQCERWAEGRA